MKTPGSNELTRRRILQGCAAMALTSQLPGCGSSSGGSTASLAAIGDSVNPQPVPTGALTTAMLSVSTMVAGAIPPAFVGLSYEKSNLYQPLFSASNANLIALFRALGPSVLRGSAATRSTRRSGHPRDPVRRPVK